MFFFLTLPSQSYSTLPHCFNSCGFALAAILSLTIVESFRSLVQYIMLQNTQCKEDSSPARHSCLVLPRQFELVTDGFVWTQQLVLVILGRCRFDRRIYALFRHTTLLPKPGIRQRLRRTCDRCFPELHLCDDCYEHDSKWNCHQQDVFHNALRLTTPFSSDVCQNQKLELPEQSFLLQKG